MVNLDSDLAREHPDWVMGTGHRLPVPSRRQHVLDLSNPEAAAYVLGRMSTLVDRYGIGYIKWDHNRDLVDAGSGSTGRPAVHRQTLAAYSIMAELRRRHPGLEIESCSSGGARADLGVAEHTDRIWVSDCTDPWDRQQMQLWTAQLLPLEYLGSHVAAEVNHQTHRASSLAFRAATALFGHFGIEWDLTRCTPGQLDELRGWIDLYRSERGLLHTGTLVRQDVAHPEAQQVWGVVAADRRRAVFQVVALERSAVAPLGRFTLRGLDPDRRYRVVPQPLSGEGFGTWVSPDWIGQDPAGVVLPGRVLASSGLQAPEAPPGSALVLVLDAVD
jgi:alpha-galactosidase